MNVSLTRINALQSNFRIILKAKYKVKRSEEKK